MEKAPQFIKKYSKEKSTMERQETAKALQTERTKYFEGKKIQTETQERLQQSIAERESALAENLQALNRLKGEISGISAWHDKILNYFHLKKLHTDVATNMENYDALQRQQTAELAEQQLIDEQLNAIETPQELQKSKEILYHFYEEQGRKWANSEYTKEDIAENFSEEHLSSLSLEDYALLLKRFPGHMVTHVTRQGIRDHTGHIYHSAGLNEYQNGFVKMAKSGRLHSALGVYFAENEKKEAIKKCLRLDAFETKEDCLENNSILQAIIDGTGSGSYADRSAIHFATEEVADCYYGAEKGNEIFITYPSVHIASEYHFTGQLENPSGGYHNDQWVWANEGRGMDINAGIVFIPAETQVSRKNGSRYELDEDNNPLYNTEYQKLFKRVVDSPDFYDFAKQITNCDPGEEQLGQFRTILEQNVGITDQQLQNVILNKYTLNCLLNDIEYNNNGNTDDYINIALRDGGLLYKEAEDTISSKEFWETYFANNPSEKPSKIVYYIGDDPTKALHNWKKENGIGTKEIDTHFGFSEHHLDGAQGEATTIGRDRFQPIANQVIDEYYPSTYEKSEQQTQEGVGGVDETYYSGDTPPPLDDESEIYNGDTPPPLDDEEIHIPPHHGGQIGPNSSNVPPPIN